MALYGIDNVRGGTYVTEELDEVQQYTLQKEIWGAKNLCTQCGRSGHFVKYCKYEKDVNGNDIYENDAWPCEYCDKEFDDSYTCEKHERYCKSKNKNKIISIKTCFDCGKTGHYANECLNKEESFNCRYCNKEFETQKGAIFHENVHCKSKNVSSSSSLSKNKNTYKSSITCYRCGRSGHKSPECYARTDVDGDEFDSDS
jgi:hypothetical protein